MKGCTPHELFPSKQKFGQPYDDKELYCLMENICVLERADFG